MGYLIGALFCIITWKVDRHFLWKKIIRKFGLEKSKSVLMQFLLLAIAAGMGCLFYLIDFLLADKTIVDGAAIFIAVEVNILRSNESYDKKKKKKKLYRTLAVMSDSFIYGIAAPLIYILILGNYAGVVYACIYYIADIKKFKAANRIFDYMNILPSIYGSIVLYLIYVIRNRTFKISFDGEYFKNVLSTPLLNVYILAAYIESVNYYYIGEKERVNYIKGYGRYVCRIDGVCIADYLSILYGFGVLSFILFIIIPK